MAVKGTKRAMGRCGGEGYRQRDELGRWTDRGGAESVIRAPRSYSVFGGGKGVRWSSAGVRRRARDVYNATPFIFAHGSSVFGTPIPPPPIRTCGSPPVEPVRYDRARPQPASGRSPPPEK
ncbi:hypothetical protein B0H14DRAFT_3139003 [Mycena olivaceomarginata]|nr:hypothetical protein B0H14DRAFT_3139003 [Mycena olivaceomarginata]